MEINIPALSAADGGCENHMNNAQEHDAWYKRKLFHCARDSTTQTFAV